MRSLLMGSRYPMGLGAGKRGELGGGVGQDPQSPVSFPPRHSTSRLQTAAVLFSALMPGVGHLGERRVTKSILRASASLPEAWRGFFPAVGAFPPPLLPSPSPTASHTHTHPPSPVPQHPPLCRARRGGLHDGDTPSGWAFFPPSLHFPPSPPPTPSHPPSLRRLPSRERFGPSSHGISPPLKAAASRVAHPPPIAGPGSGGCCRLHGAGCCP